MLLQFGFLIHYLLLLTPLAFSSTTYPIAKPGCQTHCGDMEIPFPFGIGSNCSMSLSFHIECNTFTNPPKAYLFNTTWEVTSITEGIIWVNYPNLISSCTGDHTPNHDRDTTTSNVFSIDLRSTPYTLSGQNWVVAIGCDDLVTIEGKAGQSFGDGCLPFCSNSYGYGSCGTTGSSARNGCCRITVPKGTTRLSFSLSDIHEKWRPQKLFPCSYAFVGTGHTVGWLGVDGARALSYDMYDLHNLSTFLKDNFYMTDIPLELEWRIGTGTCSQARRNSTSFACQKNSKCVEFDVEVDVEGYLCDCSAGYVGNPYLSLGCQDINECVGKTPPCHSICTNTPGSFTCSCPKGFYGDGTIDGTGCQPLPHSKLFSASIGVSSGIGFLVLLSVCIWLKKVYQRRRERKRKEKFFKRNGGLLLQQQTNEGTLGKSKLFSINELEKATDNFNKNRILGQGGQGTVYKGMLSDGKLAAIKKSKLVDENQLEQFINEVVILSQINHRNVVKLLGCCLETEVPILVYELVPNGTLFDFIHDGNAEFPISWNMRLKIAADVAGALSYLHSATSLPIFHRDIKSSNILLDEKYIAKVSDFGTSKSVEADLTHLTTLVKGTFGYLDPEYFQSSQFTEKSDVYSFGVVLVELLTGQKPISGSEDARGLAARFLYSMETNRLERILDGQVSEEGGKDKVYSVARLAQRCLNLKGSNRPTMKDVATELESIRMPTMPSTIPVEYHQEGWLHDETKPMMLSDLEYTWPTTSRGVTSDTSPLMIETL